jgi:hypothetical protein
VEKFLPEEYEILDMVTSSLPGNAEPVAHPFTAIVINVNACSKAHRDQQDLEICLVIPIGTFTGGALVLMETGLVLYLTQGDIAIFCSDDITHLNLHYQGKRASIVLHSDKEMRQWLRDRNGWADNETM